MAILQILGNNIKHVQSMTKSVISENYSALPCQRSAADLLQKYPGLSEMYCTICPSPAWKSLINVESSHFAQTELPLEERGCI